MGQDPDLAATVTAASAYVREGWLLDRRVAMGAAMVMGALLFAWPLTLDLALLDPDEALHASIAQEMLERGAWMTPTFLGQPFLDKPILFFWAQIVSLHVVGQTEAGVRLPGLLFGVMGALAAALLARDLHGGRTGVVAGLFYATMLAPLAQSQAGVHDLALVPWTTMSLLHLRRADLSVSRSSTMRALAMAAMFLALATLTKGLAGVALVVIAALTALLLHRRLTMPRTLCLAACVVVAAIAALPWYLAMERVHPGYLHYYFIDRHVLGYAAGTARHAGRPWWYYVPILLAGGFPWAMYLGIAWRDRRRTRERTPHESAMRPSTNVWAWLFSGLVFLSVSGVKLWTYALPLFPAIAILAAHRWDREIAGAQAHANRAMTWTVRGHAALAAVLLPAAVLIAQARYGVAAPTWVSLCIVSIAIACWWAQAAFARGAARAALAMLSAAIVATTMAMLAVLMPAVADTLSARDLAQRFNRIGTMPSHLVVIDDRAASLVFYLNPRLRRRLTPDSIASVDMVFARERILGSSPDTVVAVRERRAPRFDRLMGSGAVPYERAGQFRLYSAMRLQAKAGGS